MTEKAKEIRQTFSTLKAVGILKEQDLKVETKKFDDGEEYHTLSGNIVISVNGAEHKFRIWMNDHFASLNDNGKHKGNSSYDNTRALMDIPTGATPTIELSLRAERFNDYMGKDNKLHSFDDISVNEAKIISDEAEHMFEGKIEGVVYSIRPEIVKEEETGRLIVTFVGVGYGQKALPHTLYVGAEEADYFKDEYEIGSCCTLDIEIASKEYGATTTQTTGWGRKANVSKGFTRIEWTVIGGDPAYNEEQVNKKGEPLFISQSDIKSLMEARDIMLEQIEKEGYKDGNKGKPKQGLKAMNKPDVDLTDVECPF